MGLRVHAVNVMERIRMALIVLILRMMRHSGIHVTHWYIIMVVLSVLLLMMHDRVVLISDMLDNVARLLIILDSSLLNVIATRLLVMLYDLFSVSRSLTPRANILRNQVRFWNDTTACDRAMHNRVGMVTVDLDPVIGAFGQGLLTTNVMALLTRIETLGV